MTIEIKNHVLFVHFLLLFITFSAQTDTVLIVYLKCQTKYIFKTAPKIGHEKLPRKMSPSHSGTEGNVLRIIDSKCLLDGLRQQQKQLKVPDSNQQLGHAPLPCPSPHSFPRETSPSLAGLVSLKGFYVIWILAFL